MVEKPAIGARSEPVNGGIRCARRNGRVVVEQERPVPWLRDFDPIRDAVERAGQHLRLGRGCTNAWVARCNTCCGHQDEDDPENWTKMHACLAVQWCLHSPDPGPALVRGSLPEGRSAASRRTPFSQALLLETPTPSGAVRAYADPGRLATSDRPVDEGFVFRRGRAAPGCTDLAPPPIWSRTRQGSGRAYFNGEPTVRHHAAWLRLL
jgi:hypothetical protein